jgi:hypothetical protein
MVSFGRKKIKFRLFYKQGLVWRNFLLVFCEKGFGKKQLASALPKRLWLGFGCVAV